MTRSFTWLVLNVEVEDCAGGFDGVPGGGKAVREAVGCVFVVFVVFEGKALYEAFLRWHEVQGSDVELAQGVRRILVVRPGW